MNDDEMIEADVFIENGFIRFVEHNCIRILIRISKHIS